MGVFRLNQRPMSELLGGNPLPRIMKVRQWKRLKDSVDIAEYLLPEISLRFESIEVKSKIRKIMINVPSEFSEDKVQEMMMYTSLFLQGDSNS